MATAAEIEALFEDEVKSLHPSLYSPLEKAAIWFAVGVFTLIACGLIFANDIFWTDGLKPIVISIITVINRKLENPIRTFFLAFSLPKCSDKISVHRNVDANNTVPSATGSGE